MKETLNSYLLISSGRGPAECALAVAHYHKRIMAMSQKTGVIATVIEAVAGPEPGTFASLLFELCSAEPECVEQFCGTIQWICPSPYRPGHKRKNWFISAGKVDFPERLTLREEELRWETSRASGAGGQHVNRTESAVKVTHLPTGLAAHAQDERSQHANRKKALNRLKVLLLKRQHLLDLKSGQEQWQNHNELERGNARFVFTGPQFKPVAR